MNAFDYVALACLISAGLNGYRQGFSREFYRLARMGAALFAGSRFYEVAGGAVTNLTNAATSVVDPVFFIGITVAVWILLRSLRRWIEAGLQRAVPQKWQAGGGALAAVIKTALITGGVVAVFNLATWIPGHRLVAEESLTAAITKPFMTP
ncbi:MAG TPA: CvpA family protein [Kiritimatiellia bacterium]|nr:CvpA family protein [Kiritimatiellia bacterium]HMO98452.1 CvpA family protein [Kiritimatiellia bacterium]HMP95870.1 CvpA family protein [Kiritimatiellia bacterium]